MSYGITLWLMILALCGLARSSVSAQELQASLYRTEEITVQAGDFTAVGDLYIPLEGTRHPAVVWVHGSGEITRRLMVPLLEHYAFAGVLLTALLLSGVFFAGLIQGNPLTMVLVISFTLIPVAGVADQALVGMLSVTLAVGILTGTLVSALSNALFPDPPRPAGKQADAPPVSRETAAWVALRAVLIVMPVFVLALTNPSLYLAAIMKTVALGQQAGETDARSAGGELVGSTLMGALIGAAVWLGLSLWPSLWMLMLWLMAAALWAGSGLLGARPTTFRPSFWSNALITALAFIMLPPCQNIAGMGLAKH